MDEQAIICMQTIVQFREAFFNSSTYIDIQVHDDVWAAVAAAAVAVGSVSMQLHFVATAVVYYDLMIRVGERISNVFNPPLYGTRGLSQKKNIFRRKWDSPLEITKILIKFLRR